MKDRKVEKFNIFFIILAIITAITTTYAWIIDREPIEAPTVIYDQDAIISPSSMEVRLEYVEGKTVKVIDNDEKTPFFTLSEMLPGKMYDFHFYLKNNSDKALPISIYFDGINFEEDVDGKSLKDVLWFKVQMISGYDSTLLPPLPEFLMLNDEERLEYKQSSNSYDYVLVKSATILPYKSLGAEVEYLISVMIDTSADSSYESKSLTIEQLRVEM